MKNKILFAMLLLSAMAEAQNLNIPDTNFKNKLLSASAVNSVALDNSGDSVVIDANSDGIIQASEAQEIRTLNIASSAIASLQGIQGFTNLRVLHCEYNVLSSFNASVLPDLRELYCNNNSLTAITLAGLDHLEILNCSYNNITTLDLNDAVYLTQLNCSNNVLETLFIKNGRAEVFNAANWSTNAPLTYICADEGQVAALTAAAPGVTVTSNCTLEPGGEYNTSTGVVRFDADGNGCTPEDPVKKFVKVRMDTGIENCMVFTNDAGQYNFYTAQGTFTVYPEFEDNYYTVSPVSVSVPFTSPGGTVQTNDFCVSANGLHPDIEVVMEPIITAAPGYDAVYKIVYKNKGNEVVSGSIACQWDPTGLVYGYIYPAPDLPQVPGNYTWTYTDLQPFENREIIMRLSVNENLISAGQELLFEASAALDYSDDTPADNSFSLKQKVVSVPVSNAMVCIQGETAPATAIGEFLHYVVNFENTGAETVDNIVIEQDINPLQFDINSIEMLNSSHPVTATANMTTNKVSFSFKSANVVADGHGNILFKIRTKPNLQSGAIVSTKAKIFFDYNTPVETDETTTTLGILSAGGFTKDASIRMYPNPASGKVNIVADTALKSIELYDVQGRLLQADVVNDTAAALDISGRAKGIYFIKVTSEKGVQAEKIVKE